MNLKKTVVHEMHEKTRTKPKRFFFTQCSLTGDESNDCNPGFYFVHFVFFVDTGVLG